MKIRFKDILIGILFLLVIALFWWAMSERKKGQLKDKTIRRLTDDIDEIRTAYLDLLQRHLLLEGKTSPDILRELENLKNKITTLSKDAHIELGNVIALVNTGMYEKAIKDLAKIIENILKERAQNDSSFKKKPTLSNLLEHAKSCNWIKPHEHAFGELIREIRNRESHELNVQVDSHRVGLAIFSGIEIIYSLSAATPKS